MAGFPAIKTLDDFDYDFATGIKHKVLEGLRSLSFCRKTRKYYSAWSFWSRKNPYSYCPWLCSNTMRNQN
ncbi:hypothetical protein [Rickettsia felis]|uniref:hypothetical protein n=1 Tax=Rickettsia felis TaxID=42862 RepID=UPI000A67E790|nr:hypothetical protein [Rickettsia felis]